MRHHRFVRDSLHLSYLILTTSLNLFPVASFAYPYRTSPSRTRFFRKKREAQTRRLMLVRSVLHISPLIFMSTLLNPFLVAPFTYLKERFPPTAASCFTTCSSYLISMIILSPLTHSLILIEAEKKIREKGSPMPSHVIGKSLFDSIIQHQVAFRIPANEASSQSGYVFENLLSQDAR